MKLCKLVGDRLKERPADCSIDSHAFMIRGCYVKYVANGIFSSYAVLRRITRKIERIIREEMDGIDGQEVLFPVVLPASLWQESGRYESVGSELLRFEDRNGSPMMLAMTHEEAAVQLVREYGRSYAKYPFMIYQIQTKFRDEPRPRGGLIRVREFVMKDAYSFHLTKECLEDYYDAAFKAYERIFKRAGIPETVAVKSDSGMMGGKIAHEFMLLTPIGEDTVITCKRCDYRANMEAAESIVTNKNAWEIQPLQKVHTPGKKTIDDVCEYLDSPVKKSCKAVVYQENLTDKYVIVYIRGDLDVNEIKLKNILRCELHPAVIDDDAPFAAGFIGPAASQAKNAVLVFDNSLKGIGSICCGANDTDYHFTGFNIERDFGEAVYHDTAKVFEDGVCPKCGAPALRISRGIELGNIFQLGTKYTESMGMQYTDENGKQHYPIMGCYGIGVERLAASVCEARHDGYGPIWPISIAPWQVHLCCVRADDEPVKAFADSLYKSLAAENIEVIYDDRVVSAGIMFSDADLLGVPVRIIASPRNLKENCCEIMTRDKSVTRKVKTEDVLPDVKALIKELESRI